MSHPLRRFRQTAPMSLDELSRRLGVSAATISRIERGKQGVSLALAVRIEKETAGAITPAELFALIPEAQEAAE
jgi:transcriptional regulator with XRE-family HTH domain